MVDQVKPKMRRVFSKEQGKWVNRPETSEEVDDDIRRKIAVALGNDFFALVDAEWLFPLFMEWQNASKDEQKRNRAVFLCEFNLALERAVKRTQVSQNAIRNPY